MSEESDLIGLIDLIHEALLDGNLWPSVLAKIADAASANQIGMSSRDQQTGKFTIIAPRTDPQLIASYSEHRITLLSGMQPFPGPLTRLIRLTSLCPARRLLAPPYITNGGGPPGAALRQSAPIYWLMAIFRR